MQFRVKIKVYGDYDITSNISWPKGGCLSDFVHLTFLFVISDRFNGGDKYIHETLINYTMYTLPSKLNMYSEIKMFILANLLQICNM